MEKNSLRWPALAIVAFAASTLSPATWSQSAVWNAEPPPSIIVPAGTPLEIELTEPVKTRNAKVGDRVYGRLRSDVMVDNWRAIEAGAPVHGSVTEVESGSNEIGGKPTLKVTFDSITTHNGSAVPINARYRLTGDSETVEDAAKVAGGAAAGAAIGHQVDDDKGSVVGGVIGAVAGAAAAKNTGDDVKLPAGKVVQVTTESAVQVER